MSQYTLNQSLSALIDNETDELELRRVLNASHDPELRATWSRYQIARAALHNEPFSARVDLSASIMAALDAEPVLHAADADQTAVHSSPRRAMPWLGRFAVAASVTLAVLGGVRFYNQDSVQQGVLLVQSEQRLPAINQSQSPAVLANYTTQRGSAVEAPVGQRVSEQDEWYERRVPNYLRQHAQHSSLNQSEASLPYARAASLEGQ
ncbi:MAG: RseA family anti-sigma factor [Pseudomonas sp.]|jgi:sigma-E factor negative regulatory protein RseA|nr:RseA family anti-sigma factor [Pseudomonas sp.]